MVSITLQVHEWRRIAHACRAAAFTSPAAGGSPMDRGQRKRAKNAATWIERQLPSEGPCTLETTRNCWDIVWFACTDVGESLANQIYAALRV